LTKRLLADLYRSMTTNKRIGSQFYSISWAEPNSLAFAYPKKILQKTNIENIFGPSPYK